MSLDPIGRIDAEYARRQFRPTPEEAALNITSAGLESEWLATNWWTEHDPKFVSDATCERCGAPAAVKRNSFTTAVGRWCAGCFSWVERRMRQFALLGMGDMTSLLAYADARGIPRPFVDFYAERRPTKSTEAIRAVETFASSGKLILALDGEFGQGKSLAAASLVWYEGGLFVPAAQIAAKPMYDEQTWRPLLRVSLLVIDDFGSATGDGKGKLAEKFDALIVDRHDNGRRTILTSNLGRGKLEAKLSGRLMDRITAKGSIVHLVGESMRTDKGEEQGTLSV